MPRERPSGLGVPVRRPPWSHGKTAEGSTGGGGDGDGVAGRRNAARPTTVGAAYGLWAFHERARA